VSEETAAGAPQAPLLKEALKLERWVARLQNASELGALRPKVAYAVTDSWKVLAGAEILRGEASSLFGLLQGNSTGYAELRWSF